MCWALDGGDGVPPPRALRLPADHQDLRGGEQGRPVQTVDPVKPTLKTPGTKRLKLKCDEPLLKFAFKFNLRP